MAMTQNNFQTFSPSEHPYITIICSNCGHSHPVPKLCGDRFCEICGRRRRFRVRSRLRALLSHSQLSKGDKFAHLIFTLKNQPDLEKMVYQLIASFRKLRQRKIWKSSVKGGAYVIEVTGSPGDWHAHMHCVIQSQYIPQRVLLKHWRDLNGKAGCFIKAIPKQAIINYLSKYLVLDKSSCASRSHINKALCGIRLFQPFGLWHKLIGKYTSIGFKCPVCGSTTWIIDFMLSDGYLNKHGLKPP